MEHCHFVNGCAGSYGSVSFVSIAAHVRNETSRVEMIILEICCIHAKFPMKNLVKKPLLRQGPQLPAAGVHAIMLRVKDGNGEPKLQMHVCVRSDMVDLL
jgi:hypothetical protein